MKLAHAGKEITVSKYGEFSATIDGAVVTKTTLSALKKEIDNSIKSPFQRFYAMGEYNKWRHDRCPKDKDGMMKLEVIGFQKSNRRSSWDHKYEFTYKQPDGTLRTKDKLLVDTKENRAAVKKARAYSEETRRIEERRRKEQERLDKLIAYHVADSFKHPAK